MNGPLAEIRDSLAAIDGLELWSDYPLSRLTSIGTGGVAAGYALVNRVGALKKLMAAAAGCPFFILGSGTNLLVSDRRFPGLIIQLGQSFRRLRIRGDRLYCGAAVSLARLVDTAMDHSFPGFEELSGIPGTVGGAAAMNAGTHITEIGDLVERLWMVDTSGCRHGFPAPGLLRGYRSSLSPRPGVITGLSFHRSHAGDLAKQQRRAGELARGRKRKHPWKKKTFGSTFKNPEGEVAARLIDRAGLKGYRIGGARVSPVHAQFIENDQQATALEILELIKHVRAEVRKSSGISLEPEVRLVGFTSEELGALAAFAVGTADK